MTPIMTATDAYLLLRAFCDELARCGMQHACTSPGSRSTPIVLSLVRERRIRCWSHLDERCAGFFAVGVAKASGQPVAVTCTSGTAAANLTPAVIEARWARVPLIVLTADRPPELREVGAGQTIDQLKLYGDAVKWFVELGVHDADPSRLRWIRELACRAYWTALGPIPGPVHINVPLREPLVLDRPLGPDEGGRPGGQPWVTQSFPPSPPAQPIRDLPPRGVVVAGRQERDRRFGPALAQFAERAGYPLLADPLSGARHGPACVALYDLLLREERFAERMRPQLVIRAGDLPTSKPLRQWLERLAGTDQLALDPEGSWQDPASVLSEVHVGDPVRALEDLAPETPADPDWLAAWRAADDLAEQALARALGESLSEPNVARLLGEWLTSETTLFVASSMPVRDVELFFGGRELAPRVLSNRGANGIDGTVSSALGAAAASEGPVVLLTGDLALLHDIGGLLATVRMPLAMTIVLLNNNGGGIFDFLPVARETDAFEEHVATPHGIDFSKLAALYGCAYENPRSAAELRAMLDPAVLASPARTTIIEIVSERAHNLALHRQVADAVTSALRPDL